MDKKLVVVWAASLVGIVACITLASILWHGDFLFADGEYYLVELNEKNQTICEQKLLQYTAQEGMVRHEGTNPLYSLDLKQKDRLTKGVCSCGLNGHDVWDIACLRYY